MRGLGEVPEQRLEKPVKIAEPPQSLEALRHHLPPPFPLPKPQFRRRPPRPECQLRRLSECPPKPPGHLVVRGIQPKFPGDPGIRAPHRFARVEKRPGGIEEYRPQPRHPALQA